MNQYIYRIAGNFRMVQIFISYECSVCENKKYENLKVRKFMTLKQCVNLDHVVNSFAMLLLVFSPSYERPTQRPQSFDSNRNQKDSQSWRKIIM